MIVNLRIDRLPRIHIVDRYFGAVKSLGIVNDRKGLDYYIPPGEEVDLSVLPDPFRQGYSDMRPFIAGILAALW